MRKWGDMGRKRGGVSQEGSGEDGAEETNIRLVSRTGKGKGAWRVSSSPHLSISPSWEGTAALSQGGDRGQLEGLP